VSQSCPAKGLRFSSECYCAGSGVRSAYLSEGRIGDLDYHLWNEICICFIAGQQSTSRIQNVTHSITGSKTTHDVSFEATGKGTNVSSSDIADEVGDRSLTS